MSKKNQVRDELGRYGQSLSKTRWDARRKKFVPRETGSPTTLKRSDAYLSIEEVALLVELTNSERKVERYAELIPQLAPIHRRKAAKILLALVRLQRTKSEQK